MTEKDLLLAGAARADITPAVGTLLYGYRPHQVSTSVHDPLNVTALAVRQGEKTAILLTVTVGDIQTALATELRQKAAEVCGVPAAHILLSATHTHSAPNVAGFEGWGEIDRPFVDDILLPAVKKVCSEAVAARKPAELAVGVVESKVGINRRQILRNGSITLGQNPWGCMDPNMTCVVLRETETKRGILNLIHYGCHGTAAGCNEEITRDWSGIMTDRLEAETGTLTAYWNGVQGDVGPRLTNGWTTGNIHYVEELGGVAAADALRAYRAVGSFHPESLRIIGGEISLPYRKLPTLETVREKLAGYAETEKLINIQKLTYAHWRDTEAVLTSGKPLEEYPAAFRFAQTLVALGDVVFVPFPFELFSDTALRLRAYAPYQYVLPLSNTNGYNAYLPSQDQLCRGGYEVACFNNSGAFVLEENADQQIMEANLQLMEQMN